MQAITRRFDRPELEQIVSSTIVKHSPSKIIDEGRKRMGPIHSFSQGKDTEIRKALEYMRAALHGDNEYLSRASRKFQSEAQNLVNDGSITPAEYNTLSPWNETTASAGGYNVPPQYAADIARNLGKYGFARRYFRQWPMASNIVNIPGLLTKPSVAINAENTAIAASKPVEDQTVLTAKKIAAIFATTDEAFEDSNIELYAVMIDIFSEQFGITEDTNAFQNANTNWNGLLWYGAGTITSGIAANGARAYSRKNSSTGGNTGYPQMSDAASTTDAWFDHLLMLQGQPSALFEDGIYFMDQNVLVAMLAMRDSIAVELGIKLWNEEGAP